MACGEVAGAPPSDDTQTHDTALQNFVICKLIMLLHSPLPSWLKHVYSINKTVFYCTSLRSTVHYSLSNPLSAEPPSRSFDLPRQIVQCAHGLLLYHEQIFNLLFKRLNLFLCCFRSIRFCVPMAMAAFSCTTP